MTKMPVPPRRCAFSSNTGRAVTASAFAGHGRLRGRGQQPSLRPPSHTAPRARPPETANTFQRAAAHTSPYWPCDESTPTLADFIVIYFPALHGAFYLNTFIRYLIRTHLFCAQSGCLPSTGGTMRGERSRGDLLCSFRLPHPPIRDSKTHLRVYRNFTNLKADRHSKV